MRETERETDRQTEEEKEISGEHDNISENLRIFNYIYCMAYKCFVRSCYFLRQKMHR